MKWHGGGIRAGKGNKRRVELLIPNLSPRFLPYVEGVVFPCSRAGGRLGGNWSSVRWVGRNEGVGKKEAALGSWVKKYVRQGLNEIRWGFLWSLKGNAGTCGTEPRGQTEGNLLGWDCESFEQLADRWFVLSRFGELFLGPRWFLNGGEWSGKLMPVYVVFICIYPS